MLQALLLRKHALAGNICVEALATHLHAKQRCKAPVVNMTHANHANAVNKRTCAPSSASTSLLRSATAARRKPTSPWRTSWPSPSSTNPVPAAAGSRSPALPLAASAAAPLLGPDVSCAILPASWALAVGV